MNWLGSMVLPQLRAGGNVGFAKRWIGDKWRWGYAKTGTPVLCELVTVRLRILNRGCMENLRKR